MSFYHSAVEHTFIDFDVAFVYLLISLKPCKITGHITLIKILAGLIEFGTRGIHFILKCSTCSFLRKSFSLTSKESLQNEYSADHQSQVAFTQPVLYPDEPLV